MRLVIMHGMVRKMNTCILYIRKKAKWKIGRVWVTEIRLFSGDCHKLTYLIRIVCTIKVTDYLL